LRMGGVISLLPPWIRRETIRSPSRVVHISTGEVQGFILPIEGERQVDIFLGIPFARPPIGDRRFARAEPADHWEGVRNCSRFGPRAPQSDFIWEKLSLGPKSEDCLHLNVFAPAWKKPEEGFPVLVFVHGGGFLIDSAVKYGDEGIAKYLCRHDIIVVTIQYRLGLLGFFSTGDAVCPGNLGLWDQTLALQWVRENIGAFGGDARKVTVFGQSAGGASVDLLTLSPHSRDLFHQVIPMAGNAECEWATVSHERILDACAKFAERKGFVKPDNELKTSREMIEFLRTRKGREFERGLLGRKGMDVSKVGLDLAPVIDGEFLPKTIDELRKEAPKKNIMVGTCEHEGLLFAVLAPNSFDEKGIDKLLSIVIPPELNPEWKELREEAKSIYMEGVDEYDRQEVARAYVKLYSDIFVCNGTAEYAARMSDLGNKVFLYTFDYYNPRSFGILSIRAPFKGATHCTELTYLFGHSIVFSFKFNEADHRMIDLMTRMWANFVKFGNPNGAYEDSSCFTFQWEPTDSSSLKHLKISENCEMSDNYECRRADFWRKVRISKKFAS
ncbi:hypothetical protein PFISCL1PPCAC_24373, partial [Pristionchus fissidentatus]